MIAIIIIKKRDDFDECIYLTKNTEESTNINRQVIKDMIEERDELFSKHPKFLEYIKTNDRSRYNGENLMFDVLGEKDYWKVIAISNQKPMDVLSKSNYEAILNKNCEVI